MTDPLMIGCQPTIWPHTVCKSCLVHSVNDTFWVARPLQCQYVACRDSGRQTTPLSLVSNETPGYQSFADDYNDTATWEIQWIWCNSVDILSRNSLAINSHADNMQHGIHAFQTWWSTNYKVKNYSLTEWTQPWKGLKRF